MSNYYYARPFFGEPRMERPWLASFDIGLQGGHTDDGFNSCKQEVPLLDIYGPIKPQFFGKTVILNPQKKEDQLLQALLDQPESLKEFQALSYSGTFRTVGVSFDYWQNFCHGIFLHLYFPMRLVQLRELCFKDLTPENARTTAWDDAITNFKYITESYGISLNGYRYTTWSDCIFELGWSRNYCDSLTYDFLDLTLSIGAIAPSGKQRIQELAFSVPTGNDGHPGCIITGQWALGIHDWMTFGLQGTCSFFGKKTECVHFDPSGITQGFIALPKASYTIERAPLWHLGGYFKADHISRGFSLLFALSYDKKECDTLTPTITPDCSYAPSTGPYASWNMTTLHIMAECDFASDWHPNAPRVALTFDIPLAGERVFKNTTYGALIGAQCELTY